jgi:hypothetical protein
MSEPYLIIKREQADLALATQERLRHPAFKADRTWQEEWRQRMKQLNARGPVLQSTYTATLNSGG